ncbi:SMP-30/gluconolactonase/LRE family protein [Actinomadura madurae]|uniref:SMP-30/gluconolactonase/LRE family protein n=1 Tax=Actinomadura madurae TaxID=1993 RepID=UPI0020D21D36|nr:SMP-30/gluconolactonase/LRE family protein [Actinomadura madurae]MCP9979032.1 SMP-30/gluconolactonase/LRE family protein [Actinomadura madurae]
MSTKASTVLSDFAFLEAPRWRDERLWFSDFYTHQVYSVREDGSDLQVEADVPEQPSGLGWLPDGRLLIVSMRDRRILRREADGSLAVHADLSGHAAGHLNDMVVDAEGRAYVGNFGFDLMNGAPLEPGGPAPGGSGRRGDRGGGRPLVPQRQRDHGGRRPGRERDVRRPDQRVRRDRGRRLVNRRTWARFGPLPTDRSVEQMLAGVSVAPDGACLDAGGGLWVADVLGARLIRVTDGGEITDELSLGINVFACALGGSDGRTLFACAAPDFHEHARKAAREAELLAIRVAVPAA